VRTAADDRAVGVLGHQELLDRLVVTDQLLGHEQAPTHERIDERVDRPDVGRAGGADQEEFARHRPTVIRIRRRPSLPPRDDADGEHRSHAAGPDGSVGRIHRITLC
jgi:hypothetical protein